MNLLRGLHVLVLGLGESGLACVRWCVRHGAVVSVWDSRATPPGASTVAEQLPGVVQLRGELTPDALGAHQLVLKSPGLAPGDARIAPLLATARAAGIAVWGELGLFARALMDLKADRSYTPRVLTITGTNGKTTTTAMTRLLIERSGARCVAAGNISPTMLDTLAGVLDGDADINTWPEVWVLELSSFQLEDAAPFAADAAALLNVSQDHVDWHGSMQAYVAAKARILAGNGAMVLNADDAVLAALAPPAAASGLSKQARAKLPTPRTVLRFGLHAPQHPGDFGLVNENGMDWLVRAIPEDTSIKRAKGEAPEIHLQRLMPADALLVRGRHNAANALAALALATAIGRPLAPMLHGLREYRGEPHRAQWIGAVGDVDAIDDSKGTNVGATVAALEGLGMDRAPARLVVILGGDGKGQDFTPLSAPLQRYARAVALIGRDAPQLAELAKDAGLPHSTHATLEDAVTWCFTLAHSGDAVLLSPACASLDMFRNYAHRAEVFVDAVRALALERGEVTA
jgi:UDP-N-acetylmuramoylalanine--D-glutamate ligase